MICNKCGNEIKENENFCSKCGNKIERQESKLNDETKSDNKEKKGKRKIIILGIIILVVIIIVLAYILITNSINKNNSESQDDGFKQIGSNGSQITNLSFSSMKSENEELALTDEQRTVLDYFDNDYLEYGTDYDCEDLQRYPTVFENSKIKMGIGIIKIIKSTDDEFVALAQARFDVGPIPTMQEVEDGTYEEVVVLKCNQLEDRFVEGEVGTFYGRYDTVETYEIDGKSYSVPTITASKVIKGYERYSLEDITTVAKYVFGNDIKIREAVYGVDTYDPEYTEYVVTLDDQSNANFKSFILNSGIGSIRYSENDNHLTGSVSKRLYISADFEHYIVRTEDTELKHIYIEYFNRDLTKVWSREFDYMESSALIDYTANELALQIDNDLYLIDLETGNNVIDPVLVGEKIKMVMLEDSILLIGNQSKDTIMRVDYSGNVIQKASIESEIEEFTSASTQIVNGKIVIHLDSYITGYTGSTDSALYASYEVTGGSKYVVLNKDGTIEFTTSDDIYTYTY